MAAQADQQLVPRSLQTYMNEAQATHGLDGTVNHWPQSEKQKSQFQALGDALVA